MVNKKGSALIFTFWALIFLSFMGFSITRRVNAELSLARHQLGKTRAKYAAFAGLFYVLDKLQQDMNNSESRMVDTAFNCGVVLAAGQTPEDIFSEIQLEDTTFSVKDLNEPQRFGLVDESAKININGLTERNYNILKELLILNDVNEDEAGIISASVIDWKDSNDVLFEEELGAEQEYYQLLGKSYDVKNSYFETLQELMMVRGVSPDIFQKVSPHLTVYPFSGGLRINLNTASDIVLLALARSVTGSRTNTSYLDAPGFVEKIVAARAGGDGEWGTEDDESVGLLITEGSVPFNSSERAIAAALMSINSSRSLAVRVYIQASDGRTGVKTWLDAVIKTDAMEVVSLNVQ